MWSGEKLLVRAVTIDLERETVPGTVLKDPWYKLAPPGLEIDRGHILSLNSNHQAQP